MLQDLSPGSDSLLGVPGTSPPPHWKYLQTKKVLISPGSGADRGGCTAGRDSNRLGGADFLPLPSKEESHSPYLKVLLLLLLLIAPKQGIPPGLDHALPALTYLGEGEDQPPHLLATPTRPRPRPHTSPPGSHTLVL